MLSFRRVKHSPFAAFHLFFFGMTVIVDCFPILIRYIHYYLCSFGILPTTPHHCQPYLVDRYRIPLPPSINISEAGPRVCDCLPTTRQLLKRPPERECRDPEFYSWNLLQVDKQLFSGSFRVVFWFFKFRWSNWWLNIRRGSIQESNPMVYQSSMSSLVFQATITAADPALGEALLQSAAPKRVKPQDAAKYDNG